MIKISTFDDWIDYFRQWQHDIGYDPALLGDYKFETKLGELHSPAQIGTSGPTQTATNPFPSCPLLS